MSEPRSETRQQRRERWSLASHVWMVLGLTARTAAEMAQDKPWWDIAWFGLMLFVFVNMTIVKVKQHLQPGAYFGSRDGSDV